MEIVGRKRRVGISFFGYSLIVTFGIRFRPQRSAATLLEGQRRFFTTISC
jgi:hypothetical protein